MEEKVSKADSAPLINLKGLDRHYGEGDTLVKALDNISLEIDKGEIVALLGPSGSGKTTLLNVIAALDIPTAGTYDFEGARVPLGKVESMTAFRRNNIGYIFQFFNLLADLTALENVLLVQDLSDSRDRDKAVALLKSVGLSGLEDRFPSQMSGGQRQRVAIARALAKSPRLILGDELTGNLDSETSATVMEALIKTCKKEDMTTIFVTHDQTLTRFATRIIHLDSGRIVKDESGGINNMATTAKMAAGEVIEDTIGGVKKVASKVKGFVQSIVE
ncbi:MAG: ABC transporter ATP-binding protein [Euryarchaeota archaeon]|jgi:putative ABC transport system ATP-binding protein|nr:ABC transporter ATP-binding protein [Euryarchaeota archaeon]MBT4981922.1 ABC transporter ATP-binding protein [Euryarchaeota archaeon]MBT5183972.1 ABC transporter ATP-binding protein [Euryarchaeota archaeon]